MLNGAKNIFPELSVHPKVHAQGPTRQAKKGETTKESLGKNV